MIRYALACEQAHTFESWFPSSDAFAAQVARGLVTCPVCDSPRVEKQIMAPAVARTDRPRAAAAVEPAAPAEPAASPAPAPAEPRPAQAVALLSDELRAMRAMLKAVREHVARTADYVGEGFAEEARKMHYGEIEHRSIYGESSPLEAKALLEEGIEIHPLPLLPDDRN